MDELDDKELRKLLDMHREQIERAARKTPQEVAGLLAEKSRRKKEERERQRARSD